MEEMFKTDNVLKSIKDYLTINKISKLDKEFFLHDVKTYIEDKNIKKTEINIEDIKNIKDTDFLNEDFKIYQEYEISFIQFSKNEKIFSTISVNKMKTKIFINFKTGSIFQNYNTLKEDIVKYIYSHKVKYGFLIYLFENNLEEEIEKLISKINKETLILNEDFSFIIGEGLNPTNAINDKYLFLYKNKEKKELETEKYDNNNRHFIDSVLKNEKVIVYTKIKQGKNGRNCNGEIIKIEKVESKLKDKYKFNSNFIIEETEEEIIYSTKIEGYIKLQNNNFEILNEVSLRSLNFKLTGDIKTDIESNIIINISEEDYSKDSIGDSRIVNIQKLYTKGSVGSKAIINSIDCTINGVVHKTAIINSENAKIHTLKGTFKGKNVEIEFLDGGVVEAENVIIKQSMGGKIIAKNISVEIVGSNTSFIASEKISINYLKGENNKFKIEPFLFINKTIIEEKNKKIIKYDFELLKLKKEISLLSVFLNNNKNSFKEISEYIERIKKEKMEIPFGIKSKYNVFIEKYKMLEDKNMSKKIIIENIEIITEEIKEIERIIFNSFIENRTSIWKENNKLIFSLLNQTDLTIIPKNGEYKYFIKEDIFNEKLIISSK